ncbi:polyprotein [Rhynchospora pubera]|uniref:Polyprotein n=1 Tax=Rhynchospora pubera TaxID=906938 RepID=A0AAV8FIN3_9POAL|nr:polyprotein [Rhynchospora pubera]
MVSGATPMANTTANPTPPPIPAGNPTTIPSSSSPNSQLSDSSVPINISTPIKLSSTNFLTWQAQLLPLLNAYDLFKYLSSPPPAPTRQNSDGLIEFNQDYLSWSRQDQLLLARLRASLSESIQAQVVSCSTSASLWSMLQQQFATNSRARLIDLKRQLQSATKGGSSCTEFLQQIRSLADELTYIGAPPSNDDLVLTILNGLGSEFNPFVAAVTATNRSEVITFSDLHGMLLSHEALLNSQMTVSSSTPSAFFTNPASGSASNYPNPKHNGSGNRGRGGPLVSQPNNSTGSICFPPPIPFSGTTSSYQHQTPLPNSTQETSSTQRQCQICKKYGHIAKQCRWRYQPDPSYQPRAPNSQPRPPPPQPRAPSYQAYVAQPTSIPHAADWVLDLGATHHVTNDINNLSAFYAYNGHDHLQIGDGSGLPIQNIGTTSLTLSSFTISLKDTLYVANFSRNLISLSKLLVDNPSLIVTFSNSFCIFKDPTTKRELLKIPSSNGLFYIHASPSHLIPPQALIGVKTTANIWHDRFGHPSHEATLHLLKHFSLPCTSMSLKTCHDCCVAKAHKLPFYDSSSLSTSPLQIIHSDVWGPSPTLSFNGFRYYVIFVDDFSKYSWIYFMANKSDVVTIFSAFKCQVENLFNCTIKILRTDGGTEFKPITTKFPHIVHQTTCPYTPQQNGTSERKHRHVVELSIAIMTHASIPTIYWDEIISSTIYLINRLPTHNHTIPFTALFSKNPDFNFLKVLGCLCFPYTKPYNTHKLEPRALPCVFIGYAKNQKGYRCLHLPTNKIYVSRHVQFDETTFPFQQSTSAVSSHSTTAPTSTVPLLISTQPTQNLISSNSGSAQPSPPNNNTSPEPILVPTVPTSLPELHEPTSSPPNITNPLTATTQPIPSIFVPVHHVSPAEPIPSLNQSTSSMHPMTTRSRDNTRKPRHYPDCIALITTVEQEPKTFNQANSRIEWRQAMAKEIDALATNNTWTLVPPPTDRPVIGCKWVFKIKRRSDGTIDRYKARLVAKGFHQQEGVDYFDTFSPVVRPTTIRVILAIATSQHWVIRQLDVNNAFLHGDLTERVYMSQPPGFLDKSSPNHVCLLSKSLYGLKQSPRAWFYKLSTTLVTLGFHESHYDPSLFIAHKDGHTTLILIYVDDILVTGSNQLFISSLIEHLRVCLDRCGKKGRREEMGRSIGKCVTL